MNKTKKMQKIIIIFVYTYYDKVMEEDGGEGRY